MADGQRLALASTHAPGLALTLLGAHAPGDRGQGVVREQDARRGGEVAVLDEADEPGDVDHDRAALDADRNLAVQAAAGFEQGELLGEAEVDLLEGPCSLGRVASGHGLTGNRHALPLGRAGRLRHGVLPQLPARASDSRSWERYIVSRSASSSKSTWWPSNSGPSTHANRTSPPM